MHATRPAAWPALTLGKLGVRALDPSLPGFNKFSSFHPADPFVARQWRNIAPRRQGSLVRLKSFLQVLGQHVHRAAGDTGRIHEISITNCM